MTFKERLCHHGWRDCLKFSGGIYAKEDVYNLDETGSFWRALPDRVFGKKGKQCKGGERSKERITVAFITNAPGGKEKAIVIGKSENLTRQAFRCNL